MIFDCRSEEEFAAGHIKVAMKMASKNEQYHCPPHHHWLITRILKPHVKLILWTHIPETLWHIDAAILIIRYVVSCWGTIEITLAVQNPTKFLNFRLENPDPRFFIPSQLHSRIVLLLSWIVQTKSGCTVGSRINCSCSSCSLQFNHPQVGQHRDGVTLMQKVSSQSRTLKMNVWIAVSPFEPIPPISVKIWGRHETPQKGDHPISQNSLWEVKISLTTLD